MKVLFRADAGPQIGTGHLIRCRSLARVLRSYGVDIRFCCFLPNGHWQQAFTNEFYTYSLGILDPTRINPLNGVWLSTSESQDAQNTIELINDWSPDWIVVDHYGLSAVWESLIRSAFPDTRLAAIDDLADRSHVVDLLIDHNYFAEHEFDRYENLVCANTRLCLGPEFALIDPLFSSLSKSVLTRSSIKRILISLGGSVDPDLLCQILCSLRHPVHELGLEIELILGPLSVSNKPLLGLINELKVRVHQSLPSLVPNMLRADLCIGAGGTTTWERLCLGLPTVTIATAKNQEQYSIDLSNDNYIYYLGPAEQLSSKSIAESLSHLLSCPEDLLSVSARGQNLVDGFGCERIARIMINLSDSFQLAPPLIKLDETSHHIKYASFDGLTFPDIPIEVAGQVITVPRGPFSASDLLRNDNPQDFYFADCCSSPEHTLRISILSSKTTWMNFYICKLIDSLISLGFSVRWLTDHKDLLPGDVCFILSYQRIISKRYLDLHDHNLVVHASDLPLGRGWSPMTWQILENKNDITLSLFEATEQLDDGPIYSQKVISLDGCELLADWQALQASHTVALCLNWAQGYPNSKLQFKNQNGISSYYPRRAPENSELNLDETLGSQFNLLRVVDNTNYPAFFIKDGCRYLLKVFRDPLS